MCRRKNTSDPFLVYEFYDILESVCNELGIVNDPSKIWNLDETGINIDPTKLKGVVGKGQKAHRNIQGSGKENITALACCSAAGVVLPPLIIYSAARLWTAWKGDNDLKGTFYAVSNKGFITTEIFQEYLVRFCQFVKERPLILVLDGHVTHLSSATTEKAIAENITIIKLPSHTTDLLQPLDKCAFRPLKCAWEQALSIWQRENQRSLTKSEFVDLLSSIWNKALTPTVIQSGFINTGIYPIDRNKYPKEWFDVLRLERYNNEKNKLDNSEVHGPDLAVPSTSMERNQDDEKIEHSNSTSSSSASFENLLLQKISRTEAPKQTRRKVDANATVITSEEFLKLIKEKENFALTKKHNQESKKKQRELKKMEKEQKQKEKGLSASSTISSTKRKQNTCLERPKNTKKLKQPKHKESSGSESENESWEASGNSDDELSIFSASDNEFMESHEEFVEADEEQLGLSPGLPTKYDMSEGDFLLVKVDGKKRVYRYGCIVQKILDNSELQVVFLRHSESNNKQFIVKESDVSIIEIWDI